MSCAGTLKKAQEKRKNNIHEIWFIFISVEFYITTNFINK